MAELGGFMSGLSCVCGAESLIHIDVVRGLAECHGCGQRAMLWAAEEADDLWPVEEVAEEEEGEFG